MTHAAQVDAVEEQLRGDPVRRRVRQVCEWARAVPEGAHGCAREVRTYHIQVTRTRSVLQPSERAGVSLARRYAKAKARQSKAARDPALKRSRRPPRARAKNLDTEGGDQILERYRGGEHDQGSGAA